MLPVYRSKPAFFNYDQIPPGYYHEAMFTGRPSQRFWHRQKFLEVVEWVPDDLNILDVGCGPGAFLSVLAEERPEAEGIGIDIAKSQIEFAQAEIAAKHPNLSFQHIHEGPFPFEDDSFGAVSIIEVIEHLHPYHAIQILMEARRVLRPEGKLLLTTPNYRSHWPLIEFALGFLSPVTYEEQHVSKFTPNSFVKFVESAGFEVDAFKTVFISAPFLAELGMSLAAATHRIEQRLLPSLGALMILSATPLSQDWPEPEESRPETEHQE